MNRSIRRDDISHGDVDHVTRQGKSSSNCTYFKSRHTYLASSSRTITMLSMSLGKPG
jgi:hypothetical protein